MKLIGRSEATRGERFGIQKTLYSYSTAIRHITTSKIGHFYGIVREHSFFGNSLFGAPSFIAKRSSFIACGCATIRPIVAQKARGPP